MIISAQNRIYILLILFFCSGTNAEFIISLRSPETVNDQRESYSYELVKLALEKTNMTYGSYKIVGIPSMNITRSMHSLERDTYKNLLVELSYDEKLEQEYNLIYVKFPVELGITGYRICFINPNKIEYVKSIKNISELQKLIIGQGFSWADTGILRHNGFNVVEISNYESLFKMVIAGRIDLFCRGANELFNEYESYKNMGNLIYDTSFAIFYPLPRFYYLHKNNAAAKERIEKGLIAAYEDGSLQALWLKYFMPSIQFANLNHRRMYTLENPLIKSLANDYEKYFYKP